MKAKEKRMIAIIVMTGIIVIGGIVVIKNSSRKDEKVPKEEVVMNQKYVEVLEDGTKLNKSNKLKETKQLDGMEMSEIQLTNKEGVSRILATVTNKTNSEIQLTPIKLILYDDENQILEELKGLISPMKVGESVQLNMGISIDYTNAYDLKIEKE